ncbi:MAG: glycosyltransferase [Nitrospirae bacterium]|nr:glycosyltransferase [Nitrospirota bacterium]
MSKILFMSHCVPPIPYSPSSIFLRLFKYFPEDSYIVLTSRYENNIAAADLGDKLRCGHYYVGKTIFGDYTRWSSIREWLDVPSMVAKGLSIIRKEKVTDILIHPTSGNFLLASYILHRLTGIPLYVYMLDLYSAAQTFKIRKLMSVPIERLVMRASKKVFVMSEALQDFYKRKYNIQTVLLRHPIELPQNGSRIAKKVKINRNTKKTIVFTGMIYEAQLDALQNLVSAVNELSEVEFHIYSQRAVPKLITMGLSGSNIIHHGYVDPSKISSIQREADILFLPMAFNSPYPDIIKTASPGKLPEYLASGAPVLVHAPEDAYISWYAKTYRWGLVVDKPSPELLKEAIWNLLNNGTLREQLVENALKTVQMHDGLAVSTILQKYMGVI